MTGRAPGELSREFGVSAQSVTAWVAQAAANAGKPVNMALQQRRPDGVIHHSDQGSQYASIAFGERCKRMGVRPSMGSVGDAYDNDMADSFFASLECELIAAAAVEHPSDEVVQLVDLYSTPPERSREPSE